jgi:hypothetical protein
MNKETLYAAIKSVAADLCAMSKEEFAKELEAHRDGDIAKLLLETKALDVGEIEAELFAHYSVPYAEARHIDLCNLHPDSSVSYVIGHRALQNLMPSVMLSTVAIPVRSFDTLIVGWSSQVTSVRLQGPIQMSFFTQGLPGYEMTKVESYSVARKISVKAHESVSYLFADKPFSINDEQEYKLAA